MRWAGFLENYPLIVVQMEDGTYLLIDGNHRYEAAKELGILLVPCIVKRGLSEAECYQLAIQANNATESSVPPNLIAYAEFVWDRLAEENENGKQKYTQFDVAKMLGWSRERIAQYVMLSKIKKKAWEIIVTSFEQNVTGSEEGGVTKIVTDVTFNENMLRPILDLSEDQQVELVKDLATGKIEKNAFTKLAKAYKARNEIKDYALKQLGNLGETYTNQLLKSIDSGAYDSEWQADKEHKIHFHQRESSSWLGDLADT
jgi:ParB-like chromosome segregation protein Spo0J